MCRGVFNLSKDSDLCVERKGHSSLMRRLIVDSTGVKEGAAPFETHEGASLSTTFHLLSHGRSSCTALFFFLIMI